MPEETVLFRARVPAKRLDGAKKILDKLGLKPADALNMMLAQIEIQQGIPFEITTTSKAVLTPEEQAGQWTEAFGAY